MTIIDTSVRAGIPVPLNFQPTETPTKKVENDRVDGDGLSIFELEKFLLDIRDEPEWRAMGNRCADYYDHNQLSHEVLAEYRKAGLPPLVINLIHPTINTVLGMEAKTRTDWKIEWEDPQIEEVALALGQKLHEAERMSQADRAISEAYAQQVKAGLGWVEVGWHQNPFAYRYRVRSVHRREIWWDYKRREVEDWRYLVRRQRFDADQLRHAFPQMREMIDAAVAGDETSTWQGWAERLDDDTGLGQFVDIERALTLDGQEWLDIARKQLAVFEVWYRKIHRGHVARVGDTVIEIDRDNPRHMLAIAHGKIEPVLATYPKLRQAIYLGPHRVFDRATPYPHRKMPYIPFFGYREDLTGAPYGLIRGMLSSQDEINNRRSKMRAMLNSRRTQADRDALALEYNTHEDAAEEVSRHDSYVVLNPDRRNGTAGFKVEDNSDLSQGQAAVLEASKGEIHQTSGVFPPMAGENKGGLSGLAINSLVEQGTQTLAEINDNYSWARREVGDLTLELVRHDSRHPHSVPVGEGKARKVVKLNTRLWDNNLGEEVTTNNVATAQLKLILDEVPSTPAWRQQQAARLAEVTKSLPPEMQAFVMPFFMEATDLKDRKQIARLLRKQMNIPEPGMEEEAEDPRIVQMQQEHEAAVQELSAKLEGAMKELEAAKLQAQNKAAEVAVKDKDADTKRMAVEQAAVRENLEALAELHRAEDPKGDQTPVADGMQDAIEEMLATMRAGFQEMHGRMSALEAAKAPTE